MRRSGSLHAIGIAVATLDRDDVGFHDNRGRFVAENGRINVYAGNTSSQSDNRATFTVTGGRRPDVSKRRGRR